MLSFGAGKNSAPIDYEARPPIVTPPNIASLPAPGSGTTVQNWPNDPDVKARDQQIANANKKTVDTGTALVDPGFRLPKQKVVPYEEETVDEQVLSLSSNKKEKQKLMATAKGGAAGQVDADGNPIRTALTEPPAEYRVPDPSAPEEFEEASKRGLHLGKKKKVSPSEMGGGTDDIADPVVTPTSE